MDLPAERGEARSVRLLAGVARGWPLREARIARASLPTAPVAPTIAMRAEAREFVRGIVRDMKWLRQEYVLCVCRLFV